MVATAAAVSTVGHYWDLAPLGWARYNSATLSIKSTQWHGLTLQSNFTLQKNITSSNVSASDHGNINFRVPYIWAGPSSLSPYKWFIVALNYQSPKLTTNKALQPLINNWVIGGTYTASMGIPIYAQAQDLTGTGLSGASSLAQPNRICNPNEGQNIHTRSVV